MDDDDDEKTKKISVNERGNRMKKQKLMWERKKWLMFCLMDVMIRIGRNNGPTEERLITYTQRDWNEWCTDRKMESESIVSGLEKIHTNLPSATSQSQSHSLRHSTSGIGMSASENQCCTHHDDARNFYTKEKKDRIEIKIKRMHTSWILQLRGTKASIWCGRVFFGISYEQMQGENKTKQNNGE